MSNKLKKYRKESGLTQVEMSHFSSLTQGYLSLIENGKVDPAPKAKGAILKVLRRKLKDKTLTVEAVFK